MSTHFDILAAQGEGSHLPLYKPEGLVDAFRRDADAAFLCYAVLRQIPSV